MTALAPMNPRSAVFEQLDMERHGASWTWPRERLWFASERHLAERCHDVLNELTWLAIEPVEVYAPALPTDVDQGIPSPNLLEK